MPAPYNSVLTKPDNLYWCLNGFTELSIFNCQFGEAAKHQFVGLLSYADKLFCYLA